MIWRNNSGNKEYLMFIEHEKAVPLWDKIPPLSIGDGENDIPTITPYFSLPEAMNRSALIIFPGGGYGHLADHEGEEYAEYFASRGYTCFVVKYRLGKYGYHYPVELADAARSVRLIRRSAGELDIDPNKIGVIGSSAGGHLAALLGNLHPEAPRGDNENDDISSRPDWTVLCYPVITFEDPHTSFWTRKYLCGTETPTKEQIDHLSCEKTVSSQTPPSFIWHIGDDEVAPCENSLLFASALRKSGIPFELRIYQKGGHGQGLFQGHPWASEALRWMRQFLD